MGNASRPSRGRCWRCCTCWARGGRFWSPTSPAAAKATTSGWRWCWTASESAFPGWRVSWCGGRGHRHPGGDPQGAVRPHPLRGQLRLRPGCLHAGHPARDLRARPSRWRRRAAADRRLAGGLGHRGRRLGRQPDRAWRLQHRPANDPLYQAFTSTGLRRPVGLNHVPRTVFDDPDPAAHACHTAAAQARTAVAWPATEPTMAPATATSNTVITPRAQARAGAAKTRQACPSAGAPRGPPPRARGGPAPGATRPARRQPRWAGLRRPPRAGVLGGVGIPVQLVVVAHQLDVAQLEALHLAVQLPALRRGVPARVPGQAAGRQRQPAA